jgi:diguanylate cyclase (GGDEF)-like protein
MKAISEKVKASSQPDPKILDRLFVVQNINYAISGVIASVVLIGWLVPPFGFVLPKGWVLMKANTALGMLLCIAGLILVQPKRGKVPLVLGRICGAIVVILASSALLGHLWGIGFGLETLLAADSASEMPGRMSIQTASFFLLIGPTLLLERTGLALQLYVSDALIIMAIVLVLVIAAGYSFDALNMFGQSLDTRTSPQTLVCMILVVMASAIHRMYSGLFSLIVGIDIGSRMARITLPWALLLPFMIIGICAFSMAAGWLSPPYAAALTASAISALLFLVALWLAWRINNLERDLRDLSLTDQLTQVHNRRGFYILGEYMFREGRRNKTALTVAFFDLDDLKEVNDTLGHDAGSALLADFADLLRTNFRHSDVIARVGGDEFAIISKHSEIDTALQRLAKATEVTNENGDKPYRIKYSVGKVTSKLGSKETFSELLHRADVAMYEHKQRKKADIDAAVKQVG